MNKIIPVGSVHGRFQPFHSQHLEYVFEAKKRCDFLWIGITQYNIKKLHNCPNNPHRQKPVNNPLSYFERVKIITEALNSNGMPKNQFAFTPFPIDTPDHLPDFLPIEIPIFTTICNRWNEFKAEILTQIGYQVVVLYKRTENITEGIQIRDEIIKNNPKWKQKVPQSVALSLQRFDLKQRMLSLKYSK